MKKRSLNRWPHGLWFNQITNHPIGLRICHFCRQMDCEQGLTKYWLYSFLGRWPKLKTVKLSSLDRHRAASCCLSVIETYYSGLNKKIQELGLSDCPECIYNIHEKGIYRSHNPETSSFDNALDVNIPPYFVFKGK